MELLGAATKKEAEGWGELLGKTKTD
jgi:hypothetical protein